MPACALYSCSGRRPLLCLLLPALLSCLMPFSFSLYTCLPHLPACLICLPSSVLPFSCLPAWESLNREEEEEEEAGREEG